MDVCYAARKQGKKKGKKKNNNNNNNNNRFNKQNNNFARESRPFRHFFVDFAQGNVSPVDKEKSQKSMTTKLYLLVIDSPKGVPDGGKTMENILKRQATFCPFQLMLMLGKKKIDRLGDLPRFSWEKIVGHEL